MKQLTWYFLRWLQYFIGVFSNLIGVITLGCYIPEWEMKAMKWFMDYDDKLNKN